MPSKMISITAYGGYLLHAGLTIYSAARSRRRLPLGRAAGVTAGMTSTLAGLWLYAAGVRQFQSFVQVSGLEEGKLVTGGIYRYSRNPQIVGWGLALLGAALAGRSSRSLSLVAAYFLVHRLYFPVEERELERAFGEEYRRYKENVPRFLGSPRNG